MTEIEAWTTATAPPPPPPTSNNVALSTSGAVASASSTWNTVNFPVGAVNNNDRTGAVYASGGVWADGTLGAFPDWVRIDLPSAKTIDRVVLYSVQDNYSAPVEPSDTMTFSTLGVTDFIVAVWNGVAWVDVGSVSSNNLVKRTVAFPPVSTTSIQITVNSALSNLSRIAEIEAWGH